MLKILAGAVLVAVGVLAQNALERLLSVPGVVLAIDPITASLLLASVGSSIYGASQGNKRTSQVPLETPEQQAARSALLNFGTSGRFGDFQAGAEVPLGYGDYGVTSPEQAGLSRLQSLLNQGQPYNFELGDRALQSYLATNPADVSAQFDPFKEQVSRQVNQSSSDLKRQAGALGSLYSTDTIRRLGDVQARGNETLASKLAELTDASLNRRLQAIPLAYQSAEAQRSQDLGLVGASQTYGALTRQLNDQAIKARDAEVLRRRQESTLPLESLKAVASQGSNFGVPSVEASPYQQLLASVGNIGGQYLGNELQYQQYKRYFPGPAGGVPTPAGNVNTSLYQPGVPNSLYR